MFVVPFLIIMQIENVLPLQNCQTGNMLLEFVFCIDTCCSLLRYHFTKLFYKCLLSKRLVFIVGTKIKVNHTEYESQQNSIVD